MALVLEDGSASVASANTYATANYVTLFCAALGLDEWATVASATLWDGATLRGMAYIESLSYKGVKEDMDNPLKWPRVGATNEDGYAFDDDAIPEDLKKGLSRAAYEEIVEEGVLQPNLTRDDFTTSESVDVISTSYQQGKNKTVFQAIDAYLQGIKRSGVTMLRT